MPRRRPNILLVMTDQQKTDTLGLYGNGVVRTPILDQLAEEGIVVDGHICNYPACTPARATVHTGRYPHTTRVRALHIHLPPSEITLPEVLRGAGYRTGLVGKNHVFPDGGVGGIFRDGSLALRDWPVTLPGLFETMRELASEGRIADRRDLFDTWFQADHFGPQGGEFAALRQFATQGWLWRSHAAVATTPFPAESCTSAVLGHRAAEFIRAGAGGEQPWFLWLSFPDPHNPYLAPEPYASMYDPAEVDLPPHDSLEGKPERQRIAHHMSGMHRATEEQLRRAVAMQYGMVSFVDDGLGRALAALRESGQEQETIVVFTSDHGGYVGDHGGMHKSVAFYDALIRLPFVLSWPGTLTPGRLEHGFLEQVDLMPTLLELAELPTPPGVQGRSAADAFGGSAALRPEAYAECGERRDPVGWEDLPFEPDGPLDGRYFGWDGFVEGWWGKGKMIRTEEWKYAWYANGDEELYDLAADPHELRNLAGLEEHRALCSGFRDRLLAFCVESEDDLPLHAWHYRMEDVLTGNFPWPE